MDAVNRKVVPGHRACHVIVDIGVFLVVEAVFSGEKDNGEMVHEVTVDVN